MENKLKFFDWSKVFSANDVEEAVLAAKPGDFFNVQ